MMHLLINSSGAFSERTNWRTKPLAGWLREKWFKKSAGGSLSREQDVYKQKKHKLPALVRIDVVYLVSGIWYLYLVSGYGLLTLLVVGRTKSRRDHTHKKQTKRRVLCLPSASPETLDLCGGCVLLWDTTHTLKRSCWRPGAPFKRSNELVQNSEQPPEVRNDWPLFSVCHNSCLNRFSLFSPYVPNRSNTDTDESRGRWTAPEHANCLFFHFTINSWCCVLRFNLSPKI